MCLFPIPDKLIQTRALPARKVCILCNRRLEVLNHGIAWQRNHPPSLEVNSGGLQEKLTWPAWPVPTAQLTAPCGSRWPWMAQVRPHRRVSY